MFTGTYVTVLSFQLMNCRNQLNINEIKLLKAIDITLVTRANTSFLFH